MYKTMTFCRYPIELIDMRRVPEGYYPIEAFAKGNEIVVPIRDMPDDETIDIHSCDWEGCGSLDHVVRFNVEEKYGLDKED